MLILDCSSKSFPILKGILGFLNIAINNFWMDFSIFPIHEKDRKLGLLNISLQYLTKIIYTKSIPGKISGNSGMIHFVETSQAPTPHTKACAKKLLQTLPNSIDNMERGIGLRICVMYYGLYFFLIPNSLNSWGIGIFEVALISYILLDYEDSLSGTLCL